MTFRWPLASQVGHHLPVNPGSSSLLPQLWPLTAFTSTLGTEVSASKINNNFQILLYCLFFTNLCNFFHILVELAPVHVRGTNQSGIENGWQISSFSADAIQDEDADMTVCANDLHLPTNEHVTIVCINTVTATSVLIDIAETLTLKLCEVQLYSSTSGSGGGGSSSNPTGNYYTLMTNKTSYDDAVTSCTNIGGLLAPVTTEAQIDEIFELFRPV